MINDTKVQNLNVGKKFGSNKKNKGISFHLKIFLCRSNISSKEQILSTLRNTVLLSLLLGLTWITAAIPTSAAQQYISVILNTSCGVYILVYSVLANRQVRGGVRERVSTYYSTVVSSGNSKDKVCVMKLHL